MTRFCFLPSPLVLSIPIEECCYLSVISVGGHVGIGMCVDIVVGERGGLLVIGWREGEEIE